MGIINDVLSAYNTMQRMLREHIEGTMRKVLKDVKYEITSTKLDYRSMTVTVNYMTESGALTLLETMVININPSSLKPIEDRVRRSLNMPSNTNEGSTDKGFDDTWDPFCEPDHPEVTGDSYTRSDPPKDSHTPYDSPESHEQTDNPIENAKKLANKVPVMVKLSNVSWSKAGNMVLMFEMVDGNLKGKTLLKTLMMEYSTNEKARKLEISKAMILMGYLPTLCSHMDENGLPTATLYEEMTNFSTYLKEKYVGDHLFLMPAAYKDGFWLNFPTGDVSSSYTDFLYDFDENLISWPDWFTAPN